MSAPRLSPAIQVRACILRINPTDDQPQLAVGGGSIECGPLMRQERFGGLNVRMTGGTDGKGGEVAALS